MENYLKEEDRNETIYHRKNEEISSRLQQVINDASELLSRLKDNHCKSSEYQLLERMLVEQTEKNLDGKVIVKDKKQISPTSRQSSSDQNRLGPLIPD